MRHIQL
jgi:hypothetical protein